MLESKRSFEREVLSRLEAICKASGLKMLEFGRVSYSGKEYPLLAVQADPQQSEVGSQKPKLLMTAGIHGNEPMSVEAALDFLKHDFAHYSERYSITVLPCLNPSGFEADTRDTLAGLDLNRQFNTQNPPREIVYVKDLISRMGEFGLMINLHEDPTHEKARGFRLSEIPRKPYLYYYSAPEDKHYGEEIIAVIRGQGISLSRRKLIYKCQNENGLVWEPFNGGSDDPNMTLEEYAQRNARCIFTIETPTCWEQDRRLATQKAKIKIILDTFLPAKAKAPTAGHYV